VPGQSVTGVVDGNLNTTSINGASVVYAVTQTPANGTVALNQDGTYTYTPNLTTALSGGTDSFSVTIDNGSAYRLTGIGGIIQGIFAALAQVVGLRQPDVVSVQVPVTVASTIVTIPVGTSANGHAVSPDGRFVYVATYEDDAIAVVGTITATKVRSIAFGEFPKSSCPGCSGPESLAVSPDGRRLYAIGGVFPILRPDGSIDFYQVGTPLTIIDTESGIVIDRLRPENYFFGGDLEISPDGQRVYSNTIVVDLATERYTDLGWPSVGLALSDDGTTISQVYDSSIATFETANNALLWLRTISYGDTTPLYCRAITAVNNRIYAAFNKDYRATELAPPGGVAVLDAASGDLLALVKTRDTTGSSTDGLPSQAIAASPDGNWVYVADDKTATISVIDTSTNSLVATHTLGGSPWGVTVSPDSKYVYVTNRTQGTLSVIPV